MNKYLPASLASIALGMAICFSAHASAEEAEDSNEAVIEFFKGDPDTGYPEPSILLVNAAGRDYQSLNGMWNIIVDEAGMSWRVINNNDYYINERFYPETGMNMLEHSFDSRKQLKVPGDWNSQRADLDRYRSKILYQRNIDINPSSDKKYFLHFDGANYTTDLFVNNKLVGRHIGGYTAFNFDITDFLQSGSNTIIVRVDAHLDETTVPTMRTSDFWKYGGITRDVGLITVPKNYISQYHLYLNDLKTNEIKGWVQLSGENIDRKDINIDIKDANLKIKAVTDKNGRAEFKAVAKNLKHWSPKSPTLYDVSLKLNNETITDRIGFRTISTDGLNILLNGEPVKIKGISMHEETVLHPGLSHSREDVLAQFELVKELNANFVRLAHYPHNEHSLKLADEMGLMIWSEVPIVSLIDWNNPDTLKNAKSQLTSNITRDMNRASIITWSVSNESFPQTKARLTFLTELVNTARSLDASKRPITSALLGNQREEFKEIGKHLVSYILKSPTVDAKVKSDLMSRMGMSNGLSASGEKTNTAAPEKGTELPNEIILSIDDPLGGLVDIVGYNQYFGWYYSKQLARGMGVDEGLMYEAIFAVMPKIRFKNSFGKPMIISEFGADAKHGIRSDEALIWSEEFQKKVYERQIDMISKSPYVQGFSPWVLKDFRSHLRELNGIQETYNRKGLVSETGERKLAFKTLSDYYKE